MGAGLSRSGRPRSGGDVRLKEDRQTFPGLWAGGRAAIGFLAPAWRRAGWVIAPCAMAWAMAFSPWRGPGWLALALGLGLLASAELYRKASAGGGRGSWTTTVARLSAAWLLGLMFFCVLSLLLFVILLVSAYAVASAGPGFRSSEIVTWAPAIAHGKGRVILVCVSLAGFGALGWAMTRASLGPAATVARGRVLVLATWPLTRGLGWRLLVTRLVLAAPVALLATLAIQASDATSGRLWKWLLPISAGLVLSGVWLPLNVGLMTYIFERRAARLLEPPASR